MNESIKLRYRTPGRVLVAAGGLLGVSAVLPWASAIGIISVNLTGGALVYVLALAGVYAGFGYRTIAGQATTSLMAALWVFDLWALGNIVYLFKQFSGDTSGFVQPGVGVYVATLAVITAVVGTFRLQRARLALTVMQSESPPHSGDQPILSEDGYYEWVDESWRLREQRGSAASPRPSVTPAPSITPSMLAAVRAYVSRTSRRQRLLALGFVAVTLAVAITSVYLSASVYTPEKAALSFVNAQASGDAGAMFDDMSVNLPKETGFGAPTPARLLGRDALSAALSKTSGHLVTDVHVAQSTWTDSTQETKSIDVAYTRDGQPTQETLTVIKDPSHHLLLYAAWKVRIEPVALSVMVPPGGGAVSVDGISVALSDSAATVDVLPVSHVVTMAASGFLSSDTETVPAGTGSVAMKGRLDPGRQTQAITAAVKLVRACALQTAPSPQNCPQRANAAQAGAKPWMLLNDPSQGATASLAPDGRGVIVAGRYEMLLVTSNDPKHPSDYYSGGAYGVTYEWTGTDFAAPQVSSDSLTKNNFERPSGADDASILAKVSTAFTQCTDGTIDSLGQIPGCPQRYFDLGSGVNAKWRLSGDPTSGAQVLFNTGDGSFTITGSFTMDIQYDDSPNSGPSPLHHTVTDSGNYKASGVWVGGRFIVVDVGRN